jgi:hypothetical protein
MRLHESILKHEVDLGKVDFFVALPVGGDSGPCLWAGYGSA